MSRDSRKKGMIIPEHDHFLFTRTPEGSRFAGRARVRPWAPRNRVLVGTSDSRARGHLGLERWGSGQYAHEHLRTSVCHEHLGLVLHVEPKLDVQTVVIEGARLFGRSRHLLAERWPLGDDSSIGRRLVNWEADGRRKSFAFYVTWRRNQKESSPAPRAGCVRERGRRWCRRRRW